MSSSPPTVKSIMTSAGHIAVQSQASGATYTTLAHNVCSQATISNQSGTTIEVRHNGAGDGFNVPTGAVVLLEGIESTNQISFRRADVSNTQVTVHFRWNN
jgi:hypothetical protein